MTLPHLMVAPNGARRTKRDHPALPITLDEITETARACRAAGADGLHLHLRDDDGGHLLDSGAYREALTHLAERLPDLPVQITTESAGIYSPAHQRYVALHSGASLISVSVREMLVDGAAQTSRFYLDCAARGISVQHILYDASDAAVLAQVLPETLFRAPELQLVFVLGRYGADRAARPEWLSPFLRWMRDESITPDWAVCAFGQGETACLRHAAEQGGKCRVGFENSLLRADGSRAENNAQRVSDVIAATADLLNGPAAA